MAAAALCCSSLIPLTTATKSSFNSWSFYDKHQHEDWQIGLRFPPRRTPGKGKCRAFYGSGGLRKGVEASSIDDCFFGGFSQSHLSTKKLTTMRGKVRVAADYPDSKPDASPLLGDMGYHPLENISSLEKKKSIKFADRRLTDAEMARTLAEERSDAIIFTSVISDHEDVFGIEVQFLVDEHGDFYFQVYDDSEFLPILNNTEIYKHVVIGFGSIDDWIIEHEDIQGYNVIQDFEHNSSDQSEEVWILVSPETVEITLEELDQEPIESAGDWAGLNTLLSIHPMDFAERLAKAVSTDHLEKMRNPSNSLRIVGEVRRLDQEEESYVQRIWYDQFHWDAESTEDSEGTEDLGEEIQENLAENSKSENNEGMPKVGIDDSVTLGVVENTEYSEVGISFFKLDIKSIQLLRGYAHQSSVDLLEFRQSKPDILAQSAAAIIERLNSGGKKVENAIKELCRRRKGLQVEEAFLIGLDSYGVDLRVHLGREVKTLRISFSQRATSVENAEQLLNQLLFPRFRHKGRKRHRFRSQKNI